MGRWYKSDRTLHLRLARSPHTRILRPCNSELKDRISQMTSSARVPFVMCDAVALRFRCDLRLNLRRPGSQPVHEDDMLVT